MQSDTIFCLDQAYKVTDPRLLSRLWKPEELHACQRYAENDVNGFQFEGGRGRHLNGLINDLRGQKLGAIKKSVVSPPEVFIAVVSQTAFGRKS